MFILKEPLDTFCDSWCFVGSRVTCNPPPMDTDCDILCLTEDDLDNDRFIDYLEEQGWFTGGGYSQMDFFESWTKTLDGVPYNIILTQRSLWYDTFIRATIECRKKNLLKKKDRVSKFNHIFKKAKKELYNVPAGNWATTGYYYESSEGILTTSP